MPKERTIQHWRGIEADRSGATPEAGELLVTTDERKVYLGDGSTAGGHLVGPDGNFALGHRSGTRYGAGTMFTVPAGAAMSSNLLVFVPFPVGKRTTFAEIGLQVSAAGSANARLGIYANGDGEPADLILDAGTVSVASTGVKTIAISQELDPGWVWLAAVFQSGATASAVASITTVSHPSLGFGTAPTVQQGMFQVFGYAALPASATSPILTGAALPILFLGV